MKNKIFFLISSSLIIAIASLFLITFLIEKETIHKLSTQQLNSKIDERVHFFNNFIEHRQKLLNSLVLNKSFIDFVKSGKNKEYVEDLYLSYALSHKEIFQLRYIDKLGNEIIRVDNYEKPKLTPKDALQNKKGRYYFEDTINLEKGKYYFSNIDLNIENGKIEYPIVPTLRIATPIIIDGIKYGISIININLSEFLKEIQDTSLHYVNLIYDDGQIIISKNSDFNWSRDYKLEFNIEDIFSKLPKDYNKSDSIRNKDFFITKLDIDTKNKVFMILLPKELKTYDLLYADLKKNFLFLIIIIIVTIFISYLISNYIEKYYQKKISLKKELTKLKIAIEHSPISIVITNKDGDIEYVNPHFTEVTGYTFSEAVGKNPKILKSEFTKPNEYAILWETLISKKTWKGTFKNINKQGEEFWESAIITPIYDNPTDKKITNFLAIKQEITKEIYLEEELKNKEEMMIAQSRHAAMGEMISMIAHQWRQPISVIAMIANNNLLDLELGLIDEDELKEQSNSILTQTSYLSETIEDFRNYFRPNKEKEIISPNEVINESLKIINQSLENNNIKLRLLIKDNSEVEIFSRELLQVLLNILKNAKEALDNKKIKNKNILIFIKKRNKNIRIGIYNNGGTINKKISKSIFDPYFSTKTEKMGTGLGLYMSKTIIEKHLDGELSFKNYKRGVCFFIDLPLYFKK
ncbi:MAG: PAS domain S-box protein [Poseidonibacter sp.]|uniref:PAS domain-containing sensor histidine kinase n=1 Tax=Poseidonibacter sp. TaxID=2321188 RepID=UPI00359D87A3